MSIDAGTKLGAYEILSLLGAGGMGEVYRARDTKLQRDVAIKVLPELFAADPDRLARFRREAHILASLNHPGIAAIYGLEETDRLRGLVLELVEGPTLHDRIVQGPLPVDEALPIARQIAEALDAAHVHGIIHRDLKPSNIKLRPDGTVKVLDFGLAKVYAGDSSAPDVSQSPTVTVGGTREGVILGTAAYLSPEQARGKPLDKRTDIWAFGCVVYEMLVGRRLFHAETTSETLARILEREPNWDALPLATPPGIKNLLRRCLQKNLHHRLRDIGDARIEIDEAAGSAAVQVASSAAPRRRIGRFSLVAVSAGVGAVAALSVLLMLRPASTPTRLLTRFATALAANEEFFGANMPTVALSPDGTRFAYTARRGGTSQLYLRSIDSLEASAIPGTEGAHGGPFFSPDGQWIGFFATGKLKKVAVTGGEPVALADVAAGCGASWAADDTIVFSPTQFSGVMQVSASGGVPRMLTSLDPKQGDI